MLVVIAELMVLAESTQLSPGACGIEKRQFAELCSLWLVDCTTFGENVSLRVRIRLRIEKSCSLTS